MENHSIKITLTTELESILYKYYSKQEEASAATVKAVGTTYTEAGRMHAYNASSLQREANALAVSVCNALVEGLIDD